MKVYALQYAIHWEDKAANQRLLEEEFARLQPQPGSLVALPEMSCLGFTMRREGLAEDLEGPTRTFFAQLARQYQITLIAGLSGWGPQGKGRNLALVLGPEGQLLASYCKQHPFSFAGETEHYESGQEEVVFPWQGLQVAPLICYDLRFPETFRRLVTLGAELFVVIANWPSARVAHWDLLLQARAIENQAYVLGVNRCGQDPKLAYPGSSRWVDPQGRVLAALDDQPGRLEGELDLQELRAYRQRFPALQDLKRRQLGLPEL